jgi:hypothetical protein
MCRTTRSLEGQIMLWLGIALVVAWAFLWVGLKIATGLIHLVVIVGLALIIWGYIKRGARALTGRDAVR